MRDRNTIHELTADLDIPAGAIATTCRGCGEYIYFVWGTPVSTKCAGGQNPTKTTPGAGVNHFRNCPQRDKFKRAKKPK